MPFGGLEFVDSLEKPRIGADPAAMHLQTQRQRLVFLRSVVSALLRWSGWRSRVGCALAPKGSLRPATPEGPARSLSTVRWSWRGDGLAVQCHPRQAAAQATLKFVPFWQVGWAEQRDGTARSAHAGCTPHAMGE